jgi:hypothetical protein
MDHLLGYAQPIGDLRRVDQLVHGEAPAHGAKRYGLTDLGARHDVQAAECTG